MGKKNTKEINIILLNLNIKTWIFLIKWCPKNLPPNPMDISPISSSSFFEQIYHHKNNELLEGFF